MIYMLDEPENKPRIVVVGVGGAGTNAIESMEGAGLNGVEFIAVNTDLQSLSTCRTEQHCPESPACWQSFVSMQSESRFDRLQWETDPCGLLDNSPWPVWGGWHRTGCSRVLPCFGVRHAMEHVVTIAKRHRIEIRRDPIAIRFPLRRCPGIAHRHGRFRDQEPVRLRDHPAR